MPSPSAGANTSASDNALEDSDSDAIVVSGMLFSFGFLLRYSCCVALSSDRVVVAPFSYTM